MHARASPSAPQSAQTLCKSTPTTSTPPPPPPSRPPLTHRHTHAHVSMCVRECVCALTFTRILSTSMPISSPMPSFSHPQAPPSPSHTRSHCTLQHICELYAQTENNVRSRVRDPKPHTRHDTTRRWRADDDAWRRHKGASGVTAAAAAAAQQQQQRRRRRKQLRCELFSDAIVPNYSHACICHIIAYADARAPAPFRRYI